VKGFPNETPEEFDLREKLYAYERRHGMSSGTFLVRYDRRELAPDPDLEEWRQLCWEAQRRRISISQW